MTLGQQIKFIISATTILMISFVAMIVYNGDVNIERLFVIVVVGWFALNICLVWLCWRLQRDKIQDFIAIATGNADDDLLLAYQMRNMEK